MRGLGWMLGAALLVGCTGKDDSAGDSASGGVLCTSADLSDPSCESGQAVLRVAVTSGGAPAPAGTMVYVTDCTGGENSAAADEFGEARFNLPAATYILYADNAGEGLESTAETYDLPGCQTTSLDLVLQ